MRPHSIGYAANFLFFGGLLGLNWDLMLAAGTIGLWCTAWTWGPLVSLAAITAGIAVLAAGPSKPIQVLAFFAATGLISDFVNLNPIAVLLGIGAMAALFSGPATDYYRGKWEPPFAAALAEGESGLVLHTSFVALALLLFCCVTRVRVNGEVHRLPWGTSAIPLEPGTHTVQCDVPYLIGGIHGVKAEITVEPGQAVKARYHAPGWIIFLAGQFKLDAPPVAT